MISPGDRVVAHKASFEGRVLGRHGSVSAGSGFEYRSLPKNLNVPIYAVLNDDTGEVRYCTASAIEPAND